MNTPNEKQQEKIVSTIVVPAYAEQGKKKVSFIQKFKEKREEKKAKKLSEPVEKKAKVLRQTPSILPFLNINEDCITLKNGTMDILQIKAKDLYSSNEQDLQINLYSQARFLRSYFASFKIIALNFPTTTEEQQRYWLKKKEKTTDNLRLKFIERKLYELEFLERERMNREFFLFIYAENQQQLDEFRNQAIRGWKQSFPLDKLSVEKKQDVLFVLNNQNSKL